MDTTAEKTCSKCARVFRGPGDFAIDTSGWHFCSAGNLWFLCNCGQQLMLTKGRYDWFAPELFLRPEAIATFRELSKTNALPHVPAGVKELQLVVADEKAQPAKLAAAVKAAPLIAVEVLRHANALKPMAGAAISSLEHAVVYVGRTQIAALAQLASLRTFRFKTKHFTSDAFWRDASRCGRIAETLVRRHAPHVPTDEAYLGACMANIGKVVAAICYPEKTDEVQRLVTASKKLPSWREAERQCGAVDHTLLGEIAAVVWGLPRFVKDAAMRHHEGARDPKAKVNALDVVTLANQLVHWVGLAPNRIEQELMKGAGKRFGLDENGLQLVVDEVMASEKKASEL